MSHPLSRLPDPDELRRKALALAVLDAVICPEWEFRYYSFDPNWSLGQWMASMRNGSGDHWFLVGIAGVGAALKGLSHESPAFRHNDSLPSILNEVPELLAADFTNEPAFDMRNVSFVAWWLDTNPVWRVGTAKQEDGSGWLLEVLLGMPAAYHRFAEEYFERDVPIAAVESTFLGVPMTRQVAGSLNPSLDWPQCKEMLAELGYPCAEP